MVSQVISLGLYYLPASLSPFDQVDTLDYPTEWRDISEKALALADWSGRPQARTIQAMLMMAYFWYNVGSVFASLVRSCSPDVVDCVGRWIDWSYG